MAALTEARLTPRRTGDAIAVGVAADTRILEGALVCLNAAGTATKGATALNLLAVGIAAAEADNTDGSAGDVTVQIKKGIFRFENSAAADAITAAEIGDTAYVVDDQTVAKTDGTGTRSAAGKIFDVDAQGVWIDLR